MLKKLILLAALPLQLIAFEVKPWFYEFLEFQFTPGYTYRYYPDVEGGFNPTTYSSNDQLISLELGVSFLPNWDAQVETIFADTHKLSWGTQSAAAQFRYLWLDDVAGDPVSLTTGLSVRYVPTRSLRDVSTPYHSQLNFELHAAVGKEIDQYAEWIYRFFLYLGLGQANRGSPYLKPLLSVSGNIADRHRWEIFSEGYFGFGSKTQIDISRFDGYRDTKHHSVDLGAAYRYHFQIWGTLSFQYAYRVYAKAFPERAHTATVKYRLPFSIL